MAAQLLAAAAALLVYPGFALSLAVGVPAEALARWAARQGRGERRPKIATKLADLGRLMPSPAAAACVLLAALAASQLSIPFNPLPKDQRNLLVAAVALLAAGWATWAGSHGDGIRGAESRHLRTGRLLLAVQACWLVAIFVPAAVEQSLRPQALGTVVVPAFLALKVGAALLYLLCLPVLIDLAGSVRAASTRAVQWLPLCGLGASVYLPPQPDSAVGLPVFLAAGAGAALVAIGGGRLLWRRHGAEPWALVRVVAVPFAVLILLLGVFATLAR